MNQLTKSAFLAALLMVSQLVVVTSSADSGAQLKSVSNSKFNKLKSKVKKQGKRLQAMEEAQAVSGLYGYIMPFSPDGTPINVVVLKQLNDDGSGAYIIRTRYANSTRQVSVDGQATTPPFIVGYGSASFASDGTILEVNDRIEAAVSGPEIDYTIEKSTYSLPALVKTITSDDTVETWTCDNIPGAIFSCDAIQTAGGNFVKIDSFVRVISLLGQGGINGMFFDNLRRDKLSFGTTQYDEVLAKGVGMVLRLEEGEPATRAIFYRVGERSDGSLEDTPFAPGQLLDGLFF